LKKPVNYTDFMKLLPVVNAALLEQPQVTRLQAFLGRITLLVVGD
jgi:hypothetical protein